MATGIDGFVGEAEGHALFFDSRGVDVYASLLRAALSVLEPSGLAGALAEAWKTREFSNPWERPLLVCAALRFDAITSGAHPLARHIGDDATGKTSIDPAELTGVFGPSFRESVEHRFVQTNEVSRSIVWQLAASCFSGDAPIVVVDLGTSAGATLVGDRIGQSWRTPNGEPIALAPETRAKLRFGLDRRPVDLGDAEQATWLRACIWPGQHDRIRRFKDAVSEARRAREAGELVLERMDAIAMPAFLERVTSEHPSARVVAVQTAFIDYLPPEVRAPFEAGMRAWLAAHPERAAWVGLETAEAVVHDASSGLRFPAEIRLRRATGTFTLAWAEWHPVVVAVDEAALAAARTLR